MAKAICYITFDLKGMKTIPRISLMFRKKTMKTQRQNQIIGIGTVNHHREGILTNHQTDTEGNLKLIKILND